MLRSSTIPERNLLFRYCRQTERSVVMSDPNHADAEIRPFRIEVPQGDLNDLMDRLARTRWANELPLDAGTPQTGIVPPGWEYGVPVSYVRGLVERWLTAYDWREWEAKLNEIPQFTTTIDGQNVHFLLVRSPEPDALPLILTHGWPNSVVEFLGLVGPLSDPRAHGTEEGWDSQRIARAWAELMRRLGYDRYGAHGNDAGAIVAPLQGRVDPDRVVGVHVNQLFSFPSGDPAEFEGLSQEDMEYLMFLQGFVGRSIHDK